MRVMVLVKASRSSEAGPTIDPEAMARMGTFNEALREAGIFVEAAGLRPSCEGVRIGFDGDQRTVAAGPFLPADEQVAGYWIWEVEDMTQAIEWARRCPNPMPEPSQIEIRPFFEFDED